MISDYAKIEEDDTFDIIGLENFKPGQPLNLKIKHNDDSEDFALLNHTFNPNQIDWFKAGSALNLISKNG